MTDQHNSRVGQAKFRHRLLVIYNPTAGCRARKRLSAWLGAARALGAAPEVQETTCRGHAVELARAATAANFDAVIAAGGDGTINEIVNGLATSSMPLAILPLGTANVLAAELALPNDTNALARMAVHARAHRVWPGEIFVLNTGLSRRFLLMAGIGFDADVVEHVNTRLKRRAGKLAYAVSIFGRLRGYSIKQYLATIDDIAFAPTSLIVSRTRFYGGKFVLAPGAGLDKPRLEVVLFDEGGRNAAIGYLAALVRGRLAQHVDVRIISAARVELGGPVGARVQLDGDICAELPIRVEVARTPLALIADKSPGHRTVH